MSYLLLLLLLTLALIFPFVLRILTFRDSYQPIALLITFAGLCLAYLLSRTRYYTYAALFTVAILFAGVGMLTASDGLVGAFPRDLIYATIPILFCSLLLPGWIAAVLTFLCLAAIITFGLTVPGLVTTAELTGLAIFIGVVSALSLAAIGLRDRDQHEIQRQSVSLHQSEDRFRLVSYATNDVVWDWEISTGELWMNQSVQRLFGYSETQIKPVFGWLQSHIHPDDREKVIISLRTAVDTGQNFWSKEYRLQRADGSYIYVFDRAYIIQDENGRPVRMIGAIMDITVRKQAEEVLRHESLHDPLTGLYNRRYMEEMLQREIRRASRGAQPISLIMLDIDHFKQVNDTFGHAAGDTALRNLGRFLLKHVRGADIACRYGGDEFLLILPGASLEVSRQRAEQICREVKNLAIDPKAKSRVQFTLSLGVALFPDHGATLKAIFGAADAALYAAKRAGRNRVVLASKKRRKAAQTKDEY